MPSWISAGIGMRSPKTSRFSSFLPAMDLGSKPRLITSFLIGRKMRWRKRNLAHRQIAEAFDRKAMGGKQPVQLDNAVVGVAIGAGIEIEKILVGIGDEDLPSAAQHPPAFFDKLLWMRQVVQRFEQDHHIGRMILEGHGLRIELA